MGVESTEQLEEKKSFQGDPVNLTNEYRDDRMSDFCL